MRLKIWYLSLTVIVWILYGFLLSNWWYLDDPDIIAFASKHSIPDFLFYPSIWQSFSPFNLTPWILLSLKADIALSALNPYGYYLHQMLSLVIVALALFAILTLYIEKPSFAFIGVLIFLLNPSTLSVTSWISTRHYLEGMGFGLFSIYFYLKGLRGNKFMLIFISTLFYLLAVISKEVYVPLPFLLILLPGQDLKNRIACSIPMFITTGFYTLYRVWMLGDSAMKGYSTIWPWTLKSAILNTPKVFRFYSDSWLIFSVVCIVIIWSFKYIDRWNDRLKRALKGVFILLLFYLPIIPVSPIWGGLGSLRYFFALSLFITFCYISSAYVIFERGGRIQKAFLIASVLFVVAGFYISFKAEKALWDSEKAAAYVEGRFFLENSGRLDTVFKISQAHWFFDGIEEMKGIQTKKEPDRHIRLVAGEFYCLDKNKFEDFQVFAYDKASKSIMNISQEARKTREGFLKTLQDKPLTVLINIKEGVLNLRLGPYEGQYIFLEASPSQPDFYYLAQPIERIFGIKLTHRERIRIFRFAYTSPDGWTTFSPEFLIDWSKNQTITWSRT